MKGGCVRGCGRSGTAPTCLEATGGGVDNQDGAVGLGGSGNHVLNEIAVSGGVDDRAVVLGRLELPQGDIDGDTALALGLELVQHLQIHARDQSVLKSEPKNRQPPGTVLRATQPPT